MMTDFPAKKKNDPCALLSFQMAILMSGGIREGGGPLSAFSPGARGRGDGGLRGCRDWCSRGWGGVWWGRWGASLTGSDVSVWARSSMSHSTEGKQYRVPCPGAIITLDTRITVEMKAHTYNMLRVLTEETHCPHGIAQG